MARSSQSACASKCMPQPTPNARILSAAIRRKPVTAARSRLALVLVFAALALVLGCRTLVPIASVHDAPLLTVPDATLEDAAYAIAIAARSLGWVTEPGAPGVMTATLHLRTHTAVVRIEFDAEKYSILPVETQNIEREGDLIHPNYNGWMQNLQQRISSTPVRPRPA